MTRYSIKIRVLPDGKPQVVVGRTAWALQELLRCRTEGITSLHNPAPRLSHYVYALRTTHGLIIETVEEEHGGPYAGRHGRYFLRSEVEILPPAVEVSRAA